MSEVYESVVNLLVGKFEAEGAEIRPDTTLLDLDLDSLAVVELFVVLQEKWSVALDESKATGQLTVAEVAALVQERMPTLEESR